MSTKGKMTGPMFRLPFLYFLFYWILGRNGFVTENYSFIFNTFALFVVGTCLVCCCLLSI